ncbi:MAG TPA: hypothetical protein DD435_15670 [Cyanobacteria bacterium UBA8530]|nr:hypothetical protein [Cyanobacteria bacterium UBA8530]
MFKKKDLALLLGAAGLAQLARRLYRSREDREAGFAGLFSDFSAQNEENKLLIRAKTSLEANSQITLLVEGKGYRHSWQGPVQGGLISAEFPGAFPGKYRFSLSRRALLNRGNAVIAGSFEIFDFSSGEDQEGDRQREEQ